MKINVLFVQTLYGRSKTDPWFSLIWVWLHSGSLVWSRVWGTFLPVTLLQTQLKSPNVCLWDHVTKMRCWKTTCVLMSWHCVGHFCIHLPVHLKSEGFSFRTSLQEVHFIQYLPPCFLRLLHRCSCHLRVNKKSNQHEMSLETLWLVSSEKQQLRNSCEGIQ